LHLIPISRYLLPRVTNILLAQLLRSEQSRRDSFSSALRDHSPDLRAADTRQEGVSPGKILQHSTAAPPEEVPRRRFFCRPDWLSPEIWAVVVGGVDFCLVPAAAVPAFAIYPTIMDQTLAEPGRHVLTSLFAATMFVGLLGQFGGYRLQQLTTLHRQLRPIVMTWAATVAVLMLVGFFTKTSDIYSRGWMLSWIIGVPLLLVIGRSILHAILADGVGGSSLARNVAIIGAGEEGQRLIERFQAERENTIIIQGVFDDRKSRVASGIPGGILRGTTADLLNFARDTRIDEIVIALPLAAESRLRSLCDRMKALAVDVRLSLEPLAESYRTRGISYVGDVPVLEMVNRPLKNWGGFAKMLEDKLLGILLLMFLGPLMVVIALLIKLETPGPVFFVQKRFGFNNQIIRVLKFRTMYTDRADPSGAQRTIRSDPRVTRLGRILRLLSLDELPQLINVVRGDMSLVGPRPHAIAMKTGDRLYCDAVAEYMHRHRVKPGLTGWAQVNGLRGEVDTLEKARARVALDLYYIEHWSPSLDLKILLKTVSTLVSCENAY
jgi:polysaccharide biosynthesis protein PslA